MMDNLLLSILISTIGLGYFMYGKKMNEFPFLFPGLALMIYPYFIGNTIVLILIGGALVLTPFLISRFY